MLEDGSDDGIWVAVNHADVDMPCNILIDLP